MLLFYRYHLIQFTIIILILRMRKLKLSESLWLARSSGARVQIHVCLTSKYILLLPYLLRTSYIPSTVRGLWDRAVSKAHMIPTLKELQFMLKWLIWKLIFFLFWSNFSYMNITILMWTRIPEGEVCYFLMFMPKQL